MSILFCYTCTSHTIITPEEITPVCCLLNDWYPLLDWLGDTISLLHSKSVIHDIYMNLAIYTVCVANNTPQYYFTAIMAFVMSLHCGLKHIVFSLFTWIWGLFSREDMVEQTVYSYCSYDMLARLSLSLSIPVQHVNITVLLIISWHMLWLGLWNRTLLLESEPTNEIFCFLDSSISKITILYMEILVSTTS